MSRYVVGDIHGCFDKFMNALNCTDFDPRKGDVLYSVGDFCDRGDNSAAVLEYLLLAHNNYSESIKPVFGNHDLWLYMYLHDMFNDDLLMNRDSWDTWEFNGGKHTLNSIKWIPNELSKQLLDWIETLPYQIELNDFIIQHTTSRPEIIQNIYDKNIELKNLTLKQAIEEDLVAKDYDSWFWDRSVISSSKVIFGDKAIFNSNYVPTKKPLIIGHTPLVFDCEPKPIYDKELNIIAIDTGSFINKKKYNTKYDGVITILNLDTLEWWTSNGNKGKLE